MIPGVLILGFTVYTEIHIAPNKYVFTHLYLARLCKSVNIDLLIYLIELNGKEIGRKGETLSDFLYFTGQNHRALWLQIYTTLQDKGWPWRRFQDQSCPSVSKQETMTLLSTRQMTSSQSCGDRDTQSHGAGPTSRGLGTATWQSCLVRTYIPGGPKGRTATLVCLDGKASSERRLFLKQHFLELALLVFGLAQHPSPLPSLFLLSGIEWFTLCLCHHFGNA